MSISVFMRFHSGRDAVMLYDSVIAEMGRHEGTLAPGEIYHLAALAPNGMFVADLWETREAFNDYAMTALIPLTAKRGLFSPEVEFCDVHRMVGGSESYNGGTVTVAHYDGNVDELVRKHDELEMKLGFPDNLPPGLLFQWSARHPERVCLIGHWRAREDADLFMSGPLAEALRSSGLPQPSVNIYEVYNTMDGRSVRA